uniref:Uncharacterized protein n=1 Tax=Romanomermis culicivorax TaxID=13658 RepID=A0A915KT72_ROMCU
MIPRIIGHIVCYGDPARFTLGIVGSQFSSTTRHMVRQEMATLVELIVRKCRSFAFWPLIKIQKARDLGTDVAGSHVFENGWPKSTGKVSCERDDEKNYTQRSTELVALKFKFTIAGLCLGQRRQQYNKRGLLVCTQYIGRHQDKIDLPLFKSVWRKQTSVLFVFAYFSSNKNIKA